MGTGGTGTYRLYRRNIKSGNETHGLHLPLVPWQPARTAWCNPNRRVACTAVVLFVHGAKPSKKIMKTFRCTQCQKRNCSQPWYIPHSTLSIVAALTYAPCSSHLSHQSSVWPSSESRQELYSSRLISCPICQRYPVLNFKSSAEKKVPK